MWGTCLCWTPVVKEDSKEDSKEERRDASGAARAALQSTARALKLRPSEEKKSARSVVPENTKPATTNASIFQAVCKEYERGVFDPTQPPFSKASTKSPAVPRTPSPQQSRVHVLSCSSDPASTSSSARTDDTVSAASSRLRSDGSTTARPQPIEHLQELLTSEPPRPARLISASSPQVTARRTHSKPESTKPKCAKSSLHTGGEAKTAWLKKTQNESMGNPVRQVNAERSSSIDLEDMNDPLDGNRNYRILQPLNPGSSGSVYRCVDTRNGEEVAIKMVSRGVSNAKAAEREIANLRLCALHPYIIHMREVFLTRSHLAIVFEYAAGGNLAHYIETFQSSKTGRGISEERTRWIFQQIVVAVDFCHKMGIANRDIKLENVLLVPASSSDPTKPPIVKLCDFGFSKDENADSICKTACGTPECVAPEVLTGELYDGKSSDIWSMGVLFFAMLTGTFPFSRPSDDLLDNTASLRKLFSRIAHANYPRPSHLSRAALDLMDSMLQPEPEKRIDIAGILSHKWFGRSLNSVAMNVNKGLLEMPDSMLTGFAAQSEEDIHELLQAACHRSAGSFI